jgi:APA family basic amino acid/polyamine antiporter
MAADVPEVHAAEGARASRRFIGPPTALAIVVANMVGTGVFTTLGLQAAGLAEGFALLSLWALGGLVALCGALSYAELAAALPRSGGEYHFLSRIFHPTLGYLAGWISVTVGFAAPVGLAAMALGRYAATLWPVSPRLVAVASVLGVGLFHLVDLQLGKGFQNLVTLAKLAVIGVFLAVGLMAAPVPGGLALLPSAASLEALLTPAFGWSLVYVTYAYCGWNAAAYLINEVKDPLRTVPRALFWGTLLVTLLYLLLNGVFLRTVPAVELRGTLEVGALSARYLFGAEGGRIMAGALCLALLSTLSAMILAGPRILQVIGEDVAPLRFLALRSRRGVPVRAIALQQGLALAFIATDSFEGVLTYAGFTLNLCALLTVLGVIRLRRRAPDLPRPFRVPLYPLPPLLFAGVSTVSLVLVLWERPWAVLASLLTLGAGGLLIARSLTPGTRAGEGTGGD